MLLVTPANSAIVVAGFIPLGESTANYIDVTLDDAQAIDWDGYSAGLWHTANDGNDNIGFNNSGSCPAGPYYMTLSVLNNSLPAQVNGQWKLYIEDFSPSDFGHLDNASVFLYY